MSPSRLVGGVAFAVVLGCRDRAEEARVPPERLSRVPRYDTALLDSFARSESLMRGLAGSVARLDPEREAAAAIRRRDLRFLAVCDTRCRVPGLPKDSLVIASDSIRLVNPRLPGIFNTREVLRYDSVVARYAERYNRALWTYRRGVLRARPAT